MNDETALTPYQFTIDASIAEWLQQKRTTRSGSEKTIKAYGETIQQFRDFLIQGGLDLLSNPIDVARVAPLWASTRLPPRLKNDGTPNKRHEGLVPNSTYNNRLAILSSWYTFLQQVYKLQVPNPIKDVTKRKVQAYAAALPVEPDVVETGLESIDRNRLVGLRDYAILAVALYTGRRASEMVGLRGEDVTLQGKGKAARVLLRFHCRGESWNITNWMRKRAWCSWNTCMRNLGSVCSPSSRLRLYGYRIVSRTRARQSVYKCSRPSVARRWERVRIMRCAILSPWR